MSVSFVGELYDQFLVCRLCSESYRRPKTLLCLHTFCEQCLEMHYDMEEKDRPYRFLSYNRALACPICRSKTELPPGGIPRLPDNFLVSSLGEVVRRRKSTGTRRCEICAAARSRGASRGRWVSSEDDDEIDEDEGEDGAGQQKATIKCLDCVKMLCASCAELHRRTKVTQMHTLFDADVQKDVECKIHDNEPLRFYCEQCEACVCVLCTFQLHRAHDVESLTEGGERHRGLLERQRGACGERAARMRAQLELVERCELGVVRAEAQIRDATIEAIAAVRRREKDLMAGIRDTVGNRALRFIADKETLRENLREMETTVQMTDTVLKGTSIELLMVKKEIGEKLRNILELKVEQTPEILEKEDSFIVDFDFGDAMDFGSTMKAGACAEASKKAEVVVIEKISTREMEVQTEVIELKDVETVTEIDQTLKADLREIETYVDDKMLLSEFSPMHVENRIAESIEDSSKTCEESDEKLHGSTEKEMDVVTPADYIIPFEYVTPVIKHPAEPVTPNRSEQSNSDVETEVTVNKEQLQQESNVTRTPEVASPITTEAAKTNASNLPSSQIPISPVSNPASIPLPAAVPKSNLAQNWQNNCRRRSSIVKSFELTQLPSSTPFVTVKAMKGVFASVDNGNGNGIPLLSDNGAINSSVSNGFNSRASRINYQPTPPLMKSTGTSMKQITYQDSFTYMPSVFFFDKESCTPQIVTTNKSISTDNQGMIDKATSTVVDVTAVYRNVTSSRRLITVSRGTCTPKTMFPFYSPDGAWMAPPVVTPAVILPEPLASNPGQGYCINMPNPSLPFSKPVDTSAHLRLVVNQQQTTGNVEEFYLETH